MSLDLVSFSDLKNLLDLTDAAITDYPALGVLVNSVQYAIENYTGRSLEKEDKIETIFFGDTPSQMIYLPGIPIASITSVTVTEGTTDTVYDSGDYSITDYGIKMFSKFSNAKFVVVYNGGIETASVPTDINRAALMQISYEWQSKDQIGATSVSTEGGMVSRPELGLLKETKRMLSKQMHPLKF